jgi:hypothetical protein
MPAAKKVKTYYARLEFWILKQFIIANSNLSELPDFYHLVLKDTHNFYPRSSLAFSLLQDFQSLSG